MDFLEIPTSAHGRIGRWHASGSAPAVVVMSWLTKNIPGLSRSSYTSGNVRKATAPSNAAPRCAEKVQ